MPIQVTCPCGRSLRLRDELAGLRVKCPECGDAIDVPSASHAERAFLEDDAKAETEGSSRADDELLAESDGDSVIGKPVKSIGNVLVPSMFGTTRLTLREHVIVEETKRLLSQRRVEMLITEVESAELRVDPNPMLLLLTVVTLPILIGLIFLLLYLFRLNRSLVFHSSGNAVVVGVKGDAQRYERFMQQVLEAARKARSNSEL